MTMARRNIPSIIEKKPSYDGKKMKEVENLREKLEAPRKDGLQVVHCKPFEPLNYFSKVTSLKSGKTLSLEKNYKIKTSDTEIINDFLLDLDQPDADREEVIEKYIKIIMKKDPERYKNI